MWAMQTNQIYMDAAGYISRKCIRMKLEFHYDNNASESHESTRSITRKILFTQLSMVNNLQNLGPETTQCMIKDWLVFTVIFYFILFWLLILCNYLMTMTTSGLPDFGPKVTTLRRCIYVDDKPNSHCYMTIVLKFNTQA